MGTGDQRGPDWAESQEEERFFRDPPTHVAPPRRSSFGAWGLVARRAGADPSRGALLPGTTGISLIPGMLRGVARLSGEVPPEVIFLRTRWPLRHLLWMIGTIAGMALLILAALLASYLVAVFTPPDQLDMQLLGVTIVALVSGGVAFVLVPWIEFSRVRWRLMRIEGIYLLPDAVVVWFGKSAVRVPRRLITEVYFRPIGLGGQRACQVSWRGPGEPSRTLHIGPEYGGFTAPDVERVSEWLYLTSRARGREPFR